MGHQDDMTFSLGGWGSLSFIHSLMKADFLPISMHEWSWVVKNDKPKRMILNLKHKKQRETKCSFLLTSSWRLSFAQGTISQSSPQERKHGGTWQCDQHSKTPCASQRTAKGFPNSSLKQLRINPPSIGDPCVTMDSEILIDIQWSITSIAKICQDALRNCS